MSETRDESITPYDRLNWTDQELEHLLASGERRRELIAVFGSELYGELAALAQAASARAAEHGSRVWLVPGIMGSRLGRSRTGGAPPDTLWLDPIDIIAGRLTELTMRSNDQVRSLGIVHFSYLKLKLQLAAAGYAVRCFDYDWRCGIADLGQLFAAVLRADGRDCMVVAHSMGGLVARAALTHIGLPHWTRLLLIGTPNKGSWATVQALRGTYSVVRRLAQLDRQHDAQALASLTFHSFQSLYDLLPGVANADTAMLHPDAWPREGLQPDRLCLQRAQLATQDLLPGDARSICIAGYGEPTALGASRAEEFTYEVGLEGDGTVACAAAGLSGAACYFARSSHGMLTRDDGIAAAVIEL